jgi:hypothetical protein
MPSQPCGCIRKTKPRSRRHLCWIGTLSDPTAPIRTGHAGNQLSRERMLRCCDLDTFLLAGICNVANRSALHVALPAQIIKLGSAMHRIAIVPHDEVVYPPAMGCGYCLCHRYSTACSLNGHIPPRSRSLCTRHSIRHGVFPTPLTVGSSTRPPRALSVLVRHQRTTSLA